MQKKMVMKKAREVEGLHAEILWECMNSTICSHAKTAFEEDPELESEAISASCYLEEVIEHRRLITRAVTQELQTFKGILPSKLKEREKVRRLWMRGTANQEIAHQLQVSVATVKRILAKALLKRNSTESLKKRKTGTKKTAEIESLVQEHDIRLKLEFYTDLFTQELRREGFEFERDELLSFVGVTLAEILQDYRPEKGAKFKSFMDECLKRRLHDLRRTLMRQKGYGRKKKRKETVAQVYNLPENFLELVTKGKLTNP